MPGTRTRRSQLQLPASTSEWRVPGRAAWRRTETVVLDFVPEGSLMAQQITSRSRRPDHVSPARVFVASEEGFTHVFFYPVCEIVWSLGRCSTRLVEQRRQYAMRQTSGAVARMTPKALFGKNEADTAHDSTVGAGAMLIRGNIGCRAVADEERLRCKSSNPCRNPEQSPPRVAPSE